MNPFDGPLDTAVETAMIRALAGLRAAGMTVQEVTPPQAADLPALWGKLMFTETEALLRKTIEATGSPEMQSYYRAFVGLFEPTDTTGLLRALQARVVAQRAAYARASYGAGHRVGLLLDNRPTFFLHWFALNGLGVSVVPINADLRAAELEYLVGHSEIALAVALPHRHADLAAAARAAGRPLALMAGGSLEVAEAVPEALFPPPGWPEPW